MRELALTLSMVVMSPKLSYRVGSRHLILASRQMRQWVFQSWATSGATRKHPRLGHGVAWNVYFFFFFVNILLADGLPRCATGPEVAFDFGCLRGWRAATRVKLVPGLYDNGVEGPSSTEGLADSFTCRSCSTVGIAWLAPLASR